MRLQKSKIGRVILGRIVLGMLLVMTLAVTLTTSVQAQSQSVSVGAMVDRNKMAMEDTFTLTIRVSTEGDAQVQSPRLPNRMKFELLSNWTSQSSQTSITHDQKGTRVKEIRTKEFHYTLSPKKLGRLKIDGLSVSVGSKVYKTKPIMIEVDKKYANQSPRGAKPFGSNKFFGSNPFGSDPLSEAEELLKQFMKRRRGGQGQDQLPPDEPIKPENAFFVQAEVDKKQAYIGEQVIVNWYIYTRGMVDAIDRLKFPNLKNFWKEDIDVSPTLSFRQHIVNGLPYRRALLGSYALFPIKQGDLTIDSYKVKCRVRFPSGRLGGFGFGKSYSYTRSSAPIKIQVKPLPEKNKPPHFSGAVGNFKVTSQIKGRQFPVNQPFTFKIRFEGGGNAKLIDLPKIQWPEELEQYDIKKESRFLKTGRSYKEFEVLLIPRKEGIITLPEIKFGVFNPLTHEYEEKFTQQRILKIVKGRQNDVIASSSQLDFNDKSKIKKEGLPSMLMTFDDPPLLSQRQKTVLWSLIYILIFVLLILYSKKQQLWGRKTGGLEQEIEKKMKRIFAEVEKGDYRLVGTEMTNLVYFVLGEVSEQGGANLEFNKLMEKAPPSVRKELKEPLGQLMKSFEVLGFAPESVIGSLKEKNKMRELVKKMGKLLKAIKI